MATVVSFYRSDVTQQSDATQTSTIKPQQVMFSFIKSGVDANAVPYEFVGIAEPAHIARFPVEYQTFVDTPPAEPIE